ncbi:MAG: outer membrane protein assembly factor, partial [Bacteroidota bacterium]
MQHSKAFKYFVLPFFALLLHTVVFAQVDSSTTITSVQADMVNMFNQKPKKYKIVSIKTSGNHYFDETLLISISTLNIGDEVTIPGGDNFARAINKLWAQSYFSNVEVYITKLEGTNISIEIAVTERPRLGKFDFENVSKGEKDDLKPKVGLIPGHIVTENSIRSAKEAIKKYFAEKSYYN